MKTKCAVCGADAVTTAERRRVQVGSREAMVLDEFYRCTSCGEEFYEPGQLDTVMRRASAAIRRDLELLQPEEIRAIRSSLGLSQADFERLLGVGKKTVVRWEKGTVFQSQATDTLLRVLRGVDGAADFLGEMRGMKLPGSSPPAPPPSGSGDPRTSDTTTTAPPPGRP